MTQETLVFGSPASITVQEDDVDILAEKAIRTILALMVAGHPICVSYSGGKDSSTVLQLVLCAALRALALGTRPFIAVVTADTKIENPEISAHVKSELAKVKAFADKYGLTVKIAEAKPTVTASWVCRILSGRSLPSFPQTNGDCAVDWKVMPVARERRKLMSRRPTGMEWLTCLGVRFSESALRRVSMLERQESATVPRRNKEGDLVLAPIAEWSTDAVWEYLGSVRAGVIKDAYSDLEEVFRLYADGGGTSCAVVSDSILEGAKQARGAGCSSRFGCWGCVKVPNDRSMDAMLATDPRYEYMRGLNNLRRFLISTQWDFGRRSWIGRTISADGYIDIAPDNYSPLMCRELLRYALTLDAEEREAAARLGIAPRFQIVGLDDLVALDALWSLQGMARNHAAIADWFAIAQLGRRYRIPSIEVFPEQPMPAPRRLFVGKNWDEGMPFVSGLRNVVLEAVSEPGSGCMGTRTLRDGRVILDVETAPEFTVDLEGAELALTFELESMVAKYVRGSDHEGLTEAYMWWVQLGTIALAPQQAGLHDRILARTNFKERHRLAGPYPDLEGALARSESVAQGQGDLFLL